MSLVVESSEHGKKKKKWQKFIRWEAEALELWMGKIPEGQEGLLGQVSAVLVKECSRSQGGSESTIFFWQR